MKQVPSYSFFLKYLILSILQIPQILKLVKEKETSPKEGATELMESITEMDVDMDFIPQEREQIVIVPDTNIWISKREMLIGMNSVWEGTQLNY